MLSGGLFGQLGVNYSIIQNNFQRINPAAMNHLGTTYTTQNKTNHLSAQVQLQQVNNRTAASLFSGRYEEVNYRKNIHWGVGFASEQIHYHSNNSLQGSYAYLLDLRKDRRRTKTAHLSLGFAGNASYLTTDLTKIRREDETDDLWPLNTQLSLALSLGAFYLQRSAKQSLYAGVSLHINDGGENYLPSRHYYFLAGGMFHLKEEKLTLETAFWGRYADRGTNLLRDYLYSAPFNLEGSVRLWASGFYRKNKKLTSVFLGTGYGAHGRLKVEAGLGLFASPVRNTINNAYKIGIAYDMDLRPQLAFGAFLELFCSMPLNFLRGTKGRPGVEIPGSNRPTPRRL